MATPTSWAQEVITCDLCPKPTQQFCNNCQISLCVDCVSKHVDEFQSLAHDIVPFTNRKIQLAFPECKFHSKQRCEAHCQQCDVHVCLKCIFGSHSGHNIIDIHEIFNEKKKEIEKEIEEYESIIIPMYKKKTNDTERKISNTTGKFEELEKETERHRKLWHQEVDYIFNKLGSLITSLRENYVSPLESLQSELKNLIFDMIQTVEQNKEILKNTKVTEVNNYKSKLSEYKDIPADIDVKIPSLNSNTVPGMERSIQLGEYKATLTQATLSSLTDEFSILSTRELLDIARVITTIPTKCNKILSVACVDANETWVSGDGKAICIDIDGILRDTLGSSCPLGDVAVNSEGDLIYSHYDSRSINIVKKRKKKKTIITPKGWHPVGVCCTKIGQILVSLVSTDRLQYKILRYQGKNTIQEIYKDEDGNPIYKGGKSSLFLAENNNEDICASDVNAQSVVVVDKTGRVRFRYNGKEDQHARLFYPIQIVTDSDCRIIVSDINNASLHVLDKNGQFLMIVDNCGLYNPRGLSKDSEGRLWVGLMSGEVKVIQYTK